MNDSTRARELVALSQRCGSGEGVCIRTSDEAKMFLWGRGVFANKISLVKITYQNETFFCWMAVDVSQNNLVAVFDSGVCETDKACVIEKVRFDCQVMPWNGKNYIAHFNDKQQIEIRRVD